MAVARGPTAASRVWQRDIVERIASFVDENEIACTLRLADKEAAVQLGRHNTVTLSQPVPPHAFKRRWGSPRAMRPLSLRQRRLLLELTAASGSFVNLEVAVEASGCVPTRQALGAAITAGHPLTSQWLLQQGCNWPRGLLGGSEVGPWDSPWLHHEELKRPDRRYLDCAALGGSLAMCQWLIASGCSWSAQAGEKAVKGGHMDLLEWLLEHWPAEVPLDRNLLICEAALSCNLAVLQRLHHTLVELHDPGNKVCEDDMEDAVDYAAASLTADWQAKVEWLDAQGYFSNEWAVYRAIGTPNGLERLAWQRQRGYETDDITYGALLDAVHDRDLAFLEYLLVESAGSHLPSDVALQAAKRGRLDMLRVLHASGQPISVKEAVLAAIEGGDRNDGRLPLVAWLVETLGAFGVELGVRTFNAAAKTGNLELMAWLHELGCTWGEGTFAAGAACGCEEALEWLMERGCPVPDTDEPYYQAATQGDLATLRWLQRKGFPWDPTGGTFLRCASGDTPRPALSWLVEAGCPVDWAALRKEAKEVKDDKDRHVFGDNVREAVRAFVAEHQRH